MCIVLTRFRARIFQAAVHLALLLGLGVFSAGGSLAAQPQDGDLVITVMDVNTFHRGAVLYLNPANPAAVQTLTTNVAANHFHNGVRMAPDNVDLVVSEIDLNFTTTQLLQVTPAGSASTVRAGIPGTVNGFALDGDDTWIVAADVTSLFGIQHATGRLSSYVLAAPGTFNDVAIVREQSLHYAVGDFTTLSTTAPKILGADRTGTLTTVFDAPVSLRRLSSLALDPRTGDLITCDYDGPNSSPPEPGGGVEINRVSPGGQLTSLYGFVSPNAIKINQDNTCYVAGYVFIPSLRNAILHYDLEQGAALTILSLTSVPTSLWAVSGVEVYGSRVLTCRGPTGPNRSVQIDLKSHRTTAPGAAYQIACSLGRRPGVKLGPGEWLHLDVTDSLFAVTATNSLPFLFRDFVGVLDASGAATATVQLPPGFPSGLGLTVFCAGVILNPGVVQVTNTHAFEL